MNPRRAESRSRENRPLSPLKLRWALLGGLVATTLAIFIILILVLGDGESEETTEEPVAKCEEHGITPPDPRAQPEPVSGVASETDDIGGTVHLDREFTSGYTTSQYHLFTRDVDFDEPVGVVVRLHGDGGNEFGDPDGLLNCLAAVAASHNMMLLAPLSPDEQGQATWWEDISVNLPWLRALLSERVIAPYGVDTERMWWMGYSGGAEMLTYGVLPRAPEAVTGGAVMVGGGGSPERLSEAPTPEQQESLDLIWVTGTLDDGTDPAAPFDAVEAAREGATWYRQQGFEQVDAEYRSGEDHFSLPQGRILDEALEGRSNNR